jgi:hypothetical protein
MVLVYNSRTVKTMDDAIRDAILATGTVPLDAYTQNYTHLGPQNGSAITRAAIIATDIAKYNLPLPPSPFIEHIVDMTSGESRQDFRMTTDGKPGCGKSTSTAYFAGRYAYEMADRFGQEPKDYFSLDNCALLEDTDKIMQILDEAEKQQAIIIDDAGVSTGNRDFATQSNKNISKVIQTCRTRRWFVQFNMPVVTHIDLQIRELVSAKAKVFKSFHSAGFNMIKINRSSIATKYPKNIEYNPRLVFYGRKFDFWIAYSLDRLDKFRGFVSEYEKARDEAADRLIHDVLGDETNRKDPRTKRDKEWERMVKEDLPRVRDIMNKAKECGKRASCNSIVEDTGIKEYNVRRLMGEVKKEWQ